MIPKEIIKNYIKKQINNEVLRQLRYMTKHDALFPTTMSEVLNQGELLRVKQMVTNVYDLRNSEIEVMVWELLGTGSYPSFEDWVTKFSTKSEIMKDIDIEYFNEMRFKMKEVSLK